LRIYRFVLGDSTEITLQTNIPHQQIDSIIWETDQPNLIGCDTCMQQYIHPIVTTGISVMVMDANGCMAEDFDRIFVDKDRQVYIPNSFSPNEDGVNDIFMIFGNYDNIANIQDFKIFDRWGEIVFQGRNFQPNDAANGWDGTLDGKAMMPAVFVYLAIVEFVDGEEIIYSGDVTLLR